MVHDWLNRDPIAELGGMNLYSFVYNNPLTYWDYLGNDGQSNMELLKEELGEESYDATLCKKFSSWATGVLNETPIGQAKIALTGKDLMDNSVGGGSQAAAGVGFGLPFLKKGLQCCKVAYTCVKVRIVKVFRKTPPLNRPLIPSDLGVKGTLTQLQGSVSVADDVATVRIDMIEGEVKNPFEIMKNLSELARQNGAKKLCIEATLANEDLFNILKKRYNLQEGAPDKITILLE